MSNTIENVMLEAAFPLGLSRLPAFTALTLAQMFAVAPLVQHRQGQRSVVVQGNSIYMPRRLVCLSLSPLRKVFNHDPASAFHGSGTLPKETELDYSWLIIL
jgi:hypothetical protein